MLMNSKNSIFEGESTVLAELIADPIVIVDQKGRFLGMNHAFEQVFGVKSEELIGRSFLEANILDDANKAVLVEIAEKRFKGFEIEPYEITATVKNGETKYFEVRGRRIKCSGKPIDLVLFHDVTAKKELQKQLGNRIDNKCKDFLESEDKFSMLDLSPDGIMIFDLNGNIIECNQATLDLHGFSSRDSLIGRSVFELISPKDHQKAILVMNDLLKSGSVRNVEFTLLTKAGNEFTANFSASVTKGSLGNPAGFVAMTRNICERKLLEKRLRDYSEHLKSMVEIRTAQLKDANERLVKSERLATIGELAGMVGHDLRNPLSGIKNAVYYLKKKGSTCTDEERKKMLELISNAIEHANKIIGDLLDYSGEMRLELAECSPKSLLKNALSSVQVPGRIKIVDYTMDDPAMRVDVDKIERVFVNLIKNAIDAMPEGGMLKIRSRRTTQSVEFAFIDSGKGIPEKLVSKIFKPLVTTKAQGMGFGLAICKRIVEAHDGKIAFESVVGKGTTFTITLPVKLKLKAGGEKNEKLRKNPYRRRR
jgi:PAS domain S-box-containing protein